jgi:hypothetical protein
MSSKSNMDRDAVWAAFGVPDAALRRVMGLDLSALSRRESSAAAAKAVQGTAGASRADAVETCADDLQQRCIRC